MLTPQPRAFLARKNISNITGRSVECDSCPRGSTSGMRSLAVEECKPTVAAVWANVSHVLLVERNISTVNDTLEIFADSTLPFCVDEVVAKVHVVMGNEMVWEFDDGEAFAYTGDHMETYISCHWAVTGARAAHFHLH